MENESMFPEEMYINSFAQFMGYLLMAVKGLGFLVLTWTTVVLLGGFVSVLSKKDFWCLTAITLVETAGSFDAYWNVKLRYAQYTYFRVFTTIMDMKLESIEQPTCCSLLKRVAYFLVAILQTLMFVIVMGPLAALYKSGIYIAAVISLARLIQRDYGDVDGDPAHLKPALNVLYSLAVAQGALYSYWHIYSLKEKQLVNKVVELYNNKDNNEKDNKKDNAALESDHSNNKDKMAKESDKKSDELCNKQGNEAKESDNHSNNKDNMAKESVEKYFQEIKSGCNKDPSFIKGRNLVTYAVDRMQSNSSRDDYLLGLKIMASILIGEGKHAGQRELIKELIGSPPSSSTHMLLKLLRTLDSRSPYVNMERRKHAARIVDHLADQIRLNQFPGEIQCIASLLDASQNEKEIENEKEKGKENTLSDEFKFLMKQGLGILKKLTTDEDNCRVIGSTPGVLSKIMAPVTSHLLHRTDHQKWLKIVQSSLGVMDQLAAAPGETGNKAAIIPNVTRILECSKCNQALRAVLLDSESDATYRISAAQILQYLCVHYTKDDDHLKNLKKAMTNVMPELLREILSCDATKKETQTNLAKCSTAPIHGHEIRYSFSSQDYNKQHEELLAALLSLCVVVCDSLISADQDLALQFGDASLSLPNKLKEMVERHSQPTANCLIIMKHTSKMAMSMMRHTCSYNDEDINSLIQSLSTASEKMLSVEGLMIFHRSDHGAVKPTGKTLASLVMEARELLNKKKAEKLAIEASSSS